MKFIDEICQSNFLTGKKIFIFFILFLELIKNKYGNYVVQKAIKIAKNFPKLKLIYAILNNLEKINESKLIVRWKNIISMSLSSDNDIAKEDKERVLFLIDGRIINNKNYPIYQ